MGDHQAAHGQLGFSLRFEWGPAGADVVAADCDVAVVVDVLSFTTCLSVAVDRGVEVFPYPWRDNRAERFAAERDAVLAVGRSRVAPDQVSLSPVSIRSALGLHRLVLPSPNGSTLSYRLASAAPLVIGASLRNGSAVAEWLLAVRDQRSGLRIAVIASGERWADDTLRPAVEDLWGAGAITSRLREAGWSDASPEACAAAAAFDAVVGDLECAMSGCASGRELVAAGFRGDVDIAAELDSSRSVPVLQGEAFRPAASVRAVPLPSRCTRSGR